MEERVLNGRIVPGVGKAVGIDVGMSFILAISRLAKSLPTAGDCLAARATPPHFESVSDTSWEEFSILGGSWVNNERGGVQGKVCDCPYLCMDSADTAIRLEHMLV